jgi:hypothetical protein
MPSSYVSGRVMSDQVSKGDFLTGDGIAGSIFGHR